MAIQKLQVVTTIGKSLSQPSLPQKTPPGQPPQPSALDRLYRSRPPKGSNVLKALRSWGVTGNQSQPADKPQTGSPQTKSTGLFGDLFGSSQSSSAKPNKLNVKALDDQLRGPVKIEKRRQISKLIIDKYGHNNLSQEQAKTISAKLKKGRRELGLTEYDLKHFDQTIKKNYPS